MKKILHLTFASILFIAVAIQAQVTITATGINPVVGENFTLIKGAYINPGSAGANQTWNLTSLGTSGGVTNVVSPGSTIIGSNFPNANVAWSNSTTNVSNFFKATSTALENHGKFENNWIMPYSNAEDIMHYPFTHLDSFADTWNNQYQNGSYTYYQRGTTKVKADGYGTLIIGSGTYNNVMRIRFQQSFVDSTYQIGLPLVTTNTRDEYKWYMNGIHVPIATTYSLFNNLGGPASGSTYLGGFVGINELQNTISNISIYPNPTTKFLNLNFTTTANKNVEVKIMNALGALVKTETRDNFKNGLNTISLNVETLPSGIYFAQILSEGIIAETKRFVVSK